MTGGTALSLPLLSHSGLWMKGDSFQLKPFFDYLSTIEGYDIELIQKAIDEKWIFQSDIPMGYGVGSSGALTAAAFDHFYKSKDLSMDRLKSVLSQSENFFHGDSSGLDPLTIYLKQIVAYQNASISILDDIDISNKFYLFDSGKSRNTKSLIEIHKEKLRSNHKYTGAMQSLSTANNQAIYALKNSNQALMNDTMKEISLLQYEHMQEMIPEAVQIIWSNGIESEEYYMKLSGAGGGGYFIIYGNISTIHNQDLIIPIRIED